jgi:hypothetical protein
MANKNSVFTNNNPPPVDAPWLNMRQDEVKNAITASSQTVDTTNTENDQLAKGIVNFVANADFYTDSGAVNTYVLSAVSPNKSPTTYRVGMRVRFRTTNANTGASTVNVATLGAKTIKQQDGTSDVTAGQIRDDAVNILEYDGTNFRLVSIGIEIDATNVSQGITLLRKPITLANNSGDPNNDIDFSAGNFVFDDFSGEANLPSLLTKRLDAPWAEGDGQGGLDTGTKANDTWYHCFAIYNPTTGTSDGLFSTSVSSPTMPSGYTKKRLIESVQTDGSGNIRGFTMTGDEVKFGTPVQPDTTTIPTSFTDLVLPVPPRDGIEAILVNQFAAGFSETGGRFIEYKEKSGQTYIAIRSRPISSTTNPLVNHTRIQTDNESKIQYKVNSSTIGTLDVYTRGWRKLT